MEVPPYPLSCSIPGTKCGKGTPEDAQPAAVALGGTAAAGRGQLPESTSTDMTHASAASRSNATELPASWLALPQHLRKPFWTVNETIEATGLSRATLNRHWADPRSCFPRRRHTGGRVHLNALEVLRFMEG